MLRAMTDGKHSGGQGRQKETIDGKRSGNGCAVRARKLQSVKMPKGDLKSIKPLYL